MERKTYKSTIQKDLRVRCGGENASIKLEKLQKRTCRDWVEWQAWTKTGPKELLCSDERTALLTWKCGTIGNQWEIRHSMAFTLSTEMYWVISVFSKAGAWVSANTIPSAAPTLNACPAADQMKSDASLAPLGAFHPKSKAKFLMFCLIVECLVEIKWHQKNSLHFQVSLHIQL